MPSFQLHRRSPAVGAYAPPRGLRRLSRAAVEVARVKRSAQAVGRSPVPHRNGTDVEVAGGARRLGKLPCIVVRGSYGDWGRPAFLHLPGPSPSLTIGGSAVKDRLAIASETPRGSAFPNAGAEIAAEMRRRLALAPTGPVRGGTGSRVLSSGGGLFEARLQSRSHDADFTAGSTDGGGAIQC